MARNYTNTASKAVTIGSTMTAAQTSVNISDGTTFPAAPYTARIEDEIVLVSAASGANSTGLTISRGFDGTTGATHGSGVGIHPVVVAKDFVEVPDWVRRLGGRDDTAHADDDEFDDGTLSGTQVTGAGNATWAESRGKLSVLVDTQGAFPPEVAARVYAMTPSASPVSIETRADAVFLRSNSMPGIVVGFADGATAGSNIAALYAYRSGDGAFSFYNYEGTFNAASGPTLWTNGINATTPLYIRAVWTATNTFKYSVSVNGIQWTGLGQAAHSRTLTPTHFFVGAGNVSSTVPLPVSFEYLRVYETDLSV